jgi:hypothetical protein
MNKITDTNLLFEFKLSSDGVLDSTNFYRYVGICKNFVSLGISYFEEQGIIVVRKKENHIILYA